MIVTKIIGTNQTSPETTGVTKLESKESINEIKDLRNELSLQQTRYYELQGRGHFRVKIFDTILHVQNSIYLYMYRTFFVHL